VSQSQVTLAPKKVLLLGQSVHMDLDLSTFDLPQETKGYSRASVQGTVVTTENYDAKMVRANSYIRFETVDSVCYGQVMYFYEKNQHVNCLVKKFNVKQREILAHVEGRFLISHLIPVCESDTLISCAAEAIVEKLAKVGSFLCILPNSVEKNL